MVNDTLRLLSGGLSIDDRGSLAFCNDFDFSGVKRFYLTSNHQAGTVRAWHWHAKEAKYVTAVSGAALVGAVQVDDWQRLDIDAEPQRFVLSAAKPVILLIPPGYANGWMSLTTDCQLLWFSTATLDESKADDVRILARYWDCWKIEER